MSNRLTRVLLVGCEMDTGRLAEKALAEIGESRDLLGWLPPLSLREAETVEEAMELAAAERPDVVLMDLSPGPAGGLRAWILWRGAFPGIPAVGLTAREERTLAISAVREGAQDCLFEDDVEGERLARAIRFAIERNRRAAALERRSQIDEVTGLYNEAGFMMMAGREVKLFAELGLSATLLLMEFADSGEEAVALRAADLLRAAFRETDLLARIRRARFAVLTPRPLEVTAVGAPGWPVRWGAACSGPGAAATLDGLLERAEAALCENEACAGLAARVIPDSLDDRSGRHL